MCRHSVASRYGQRCFWELLSKPVEESESLGPRPVATCSCTFRLLIRKRRKLIGRGKEAVRLLNPPSFSDRFIKPLSEVDKMCEPDFTLETRAIQLPRTLPCQLPDLLCKTLANVPRRARGSASVDPRKCRVPPAGDGQSKFSVQRSAAALLAGSVNTSKVPCEVG